MRWGEFMPRPEDDLVKNMAEAALVDSQGSIDYSDNAKAIALMSPIVQSRLIDALASGSTLESVFCFFHT